MGATKQTKEQKRKTRDDVGQLEEQKVVGFQVWGPKLSLSPKLSVKNPNGFHATQTEIYYTDLHFVLSEFRHCFFQGTFPSIIAELAAFYLTFCYSGNFHCRKNFSTNSSAY